MMSDKSRIRVSVILWEKEDDAIRYEDSEWRKRRKEREINEYLLQFNKKCTSK